MGRAHSDPNLAVLVSIDRALPLITAQPCFGMITGGEPCGAYPWRQLPANRNDNPPLLLDLENVGR
jgi:hypothetical protein